MFLTLKHNVTSLVRSHDDLPAFNAAYWVLTFLAAILFNAGAFIILIAGHMALDVYKYRDIHRKRWSKVFEGVARENLLDVTILSLGISFSVYCNSFLPIVAGLRGMLRTEITILNAIVQVAVKTHILHNILTILLNFQRYLETLHPRVGSALSLLEGLAMFALGVSMALTLLSPWILGLDALQISHLAEDLLIPWKL